jgi:hypothetical protein
MSEALGRLQKCGKNRKNKPFFTEFQIAGNYGEFMGITDD